ncbi:MAG: phytanoyl-CoA dioxygenase [Alphaproteobacteria bacterium]|jgi:hypothetical protein|nr:phytanoyl-CoA dioxygenase [Alphaproteobacteria bacterium]
MSAVPEIPRIRATPGSPLPEMLIGLATERFNAAGVMIFEQVFTPDHVAKLNADYSARYDAYHRDIAHADALLVGDRRNMISIAVSGPVNDPVVYANPVIQPLINSLLGGDVILGSVVAVTSLPGAEDQEFHIDMPLLFGGEDVDVRVPSYCLTLVLPLVDMNAENGTTAFYPGTHKSVLDEPADLDPVFPDVPVGDAILFDARVWHYGTANVSSAPRPVFYNSYQRSWFRDVVNFGVQNPLVIADQELSQVDAAYRHLFDWTRKPGRA